MQRKTSSIILGIDPGIADTGYGLIKNQGGKLSCLAYGSIRTSAKLALPDRLEIINLELNKLIKKFRPDLVAIEELFFGSNVKTALIVGQARGVAVLAAKLNKIKSVEFTPYQVKQAVAAYGHAKKGQVQRMVKLILNLKDLPKPDDAADALAIAICAANSLR